MQENNIPMKTRKKRRRRSENSILFGSIIMCIVTLCAITVCLVVVFKYRAVQVENTTVMQELADAKLLQEQSYTQEEVDGLLNEKTSEAASQAAQEKENEILDDIKELLEAGESTVRVLRKLYPDDIVIADSNQYFFFPIQDSLKKHTYQAENFVQTEDGLMEYYENGELSSYKGIDVSKYQGDINWKEVAQDDVDYAFIRLGIRGYTEGKIQEDETFEDNINGALDNDIAVGVYFFTQATSVEEAQEEAKYVLDAIEPYDVTYPIVLDVEEVTNKNGRTNDLTKEERTEYCIAFCEMIKNAGYTPMIYGNLKTFMLMLDMEQIEEYEKWFAYYDSEIYFPYDFDVWQYTDSGSVYGIEGDVDLNISFEDLSDD
ncbi:MAG: hypothetical protein IJO97_07520 [Lachnospiraceae bacterium]|nr:hypothetical protein [Lachnospiraceae bacterium]